MFVSKATLKKLKERIINNGTNIERIILHEKCSDNLQLMCIAFKKGTRYPPIADNEKGFITYVVLEGKLIINTYSINQKIKIRSQEINSTEIYKIPRYLYRETIALSEEDTIFIEIIEGAFDPKKRLNMEK